LTRVPVTVWLHYWLPFVATALVGLVGHVYGFGFLVFTLFAVYCYLVGYDYVLRLHTFFAGSFIDYVVLLRWFTFGYCTVRCCCVSLYVYVVWFTFARFTFAFRLRLIARSSLRCTVL